MHWQILPIQNRSRSPVYTNLSTNLVELDFTSIMCVIMRLFITGTLRSWLGCQNPSFVIHLLLKLVLFPVLQPFLMASLHLVASIILQRYRLTIIYICLHAFLTLFFFSSFFIQLIIHFFEGNYNHTISARLNLCFNDGHCRFSFLLPLIRLRLKSYKFGQGFYVPYRILDSW